MRIADVLQTKGAQVVTVRADISVRDLLATLAEHRIGAVVVSADGRSVDGIVSERDIVRALADRGAAVLSEYVSAIMTSDVETCDPDLDLRELAQVMTHGRFRHMPVTVDGDLIGIVSIGDIVKSRINELEVERDSLSDYVVRAMT